MRRLAISLLIVGFCFIAGTPLVLAEKQVRNLKADYISSSPHYLVYFVAQEQGFLKKRDLSLELVKMDPALGVQFAVQGKLDFATALVASYVAKEKGQPLEIVCGIADKIDFKLIAHPSIKTSADFRGKKVGISSSASALVLPLKAFLAQSGLTFEDIELIAMPSSVQRVIQVMAGNLDATVIDAAHAIPALKKGYQSFDFIYDLPFVGIAMKPDEASQLGPELKAAMIETMNFMKDYPQETVDLFKRWMPNPALEGDDYQHIYERTLKTFTYDCNVSTQAMESFRNYLDTVGK